MIKAILAVDEKGGVSKHGSMPWPKNLLDMKWFVENTKNQIVVMGRKTWDDPHMPSPLKGRINVLVTSQSINELEGVDVHIKDNLIDELKKINFKFPKKNRWIIGGPNTIHQLFPLIEQFYLTRIYGNFFCDTFLDLNRIKKEMKIIENIKGDDTCHFEVWSR